MLFVTSEFLFAFLPVTLLASGLVLRIAGREAGISVLTAASLFFYGWWKLSGLAVIAVSVGVNYLLSRQIAETSDKPTRRRFLALGITVNLAALGYFKYRNFFVDNFMGLFGDQTNLSHIIPPLAISFYTFQQIAFLVDTYHAKMEKISFRNYLISVVFFPHLIAGPLLHYRDIIQQFDTRFRVNWTTVAVGVPVFAMGMAKKLAIADPLSHIVNPIFAKAEIQSLEFIESWVASLGYTAQLYFDFSGYSDMAIGLGLMFGIALPINFFSPYKSTSIIEFWRRWHITLSNFLRDYLYIPLGGGRAGVTRRYTNLLTVMILGGLWHGAAWTFVLWGALHGALLVINHLWRMVIPAGSWLASRRLWPIYGALTFLSVMTGWVFFRAESFAGALNVLYAMIAPGTASLPYGVAFAFGLDPGSSIFGDRGLAIDDLLVFTVIGLIGYAVTWLFPNTAEIFSLSNDVAVVASRRHYWRIAAATGALLCISMFGIFNAVPSEFLYFRF